MVAAQNNDEKRCSKFSDGMRRTSSLRVAHDAENHTNFARKYKEMHRFVKKPDGSIMLYIGAENWPAPIPLRIKTNAWLFGAEASQRRVAVQSFSTIRPKRTLPPGLRR